MELKLPPMTVQSRLNSYRNGEIAADMADFKPGQNRYVLIAKNIFNNLVNRFQSAAVSKGS